MNTPLPNDLTPISQQLDELLNGMQRVDFYAKANISPGKPLSRKHYSVIAADEILTVVSQHQRNLTLQHGQLFIYNGTHWNLIEEKEVKLFLSKAAKILGVYEIDAKYHSFIDDLYKQFISRSPNINPSKSKNEVLINLKNGTFVISAESQYLRPPAPKDFLTHQLTFGFDDKADAPLFFNYLNKVLPDVAQQNILAEFVGSVFMSRKVLKLEKSLVLLGEGGNGKSVFFETLIALLGSQNVSVFSLSSLTDEKGYYRAMLKNKLLNYSPEMSSTMNTSMFKQLVSGEPIEARPPCQPPFLLEDYAKFIFNANLLPTGGGEDTAAFFRRFIIINFAVTISESECDPELATKIIENELPGVFNWVLEGLNRLLSQRKFTRSDKAEAALNEFKKEADTVGLFIEEEMYTPSISETVPLKHLFVIYKKACLDVGYRPCTFRAFPAKLRKNGFETGRSKIGTIVYIEKKAA